MRIRYWRDLRAALREGVDFGHGRSTDGGRTCPFAGATMYLRHEDVRDTLREAAIDPRYERTTNELGLLQLHPEPFPPDGLISLSSPRHDELRPWIEALCAGAMHPWSEDELAEDLRRHLEGAKSLAVHPAATRWALQHFFRILAGVDATEEDLDAFVAWQQTAITFATRPRPVLWGKSAALRDALAWRASMLERLAESLGALEGPATPEDRDVLARAVLDALTFAGGLSVPQWINAVTAIRWRPSEFPLHGDVEGDRLTALLFEVARRYPLVAAVPFQKSGERGLLYLAGALNDPEVWDGPDLFQLRPLAAYEESFIGFAEPAEGSGGRSRSCPGRSLAFAMTRAWHRVVGPDAWSLDAPVKRKHLSFDDVSLVREDPVPT